MITRMSYAHLATVFHASGMRDDIPRDTVDRARCVVTVKDIESLIIGPTFADTVALNRSYLDLYEDEVQLRRIA